ncbi:MAG: 50S ribosomal protein L14 [Candidatus Omnitrophica bacterium]|nr:50S ribosomal protein L14 [Candidatus Omnitrophota bacterium]
MLTVRAKLLVADNSGAKVASLIGVIGKKNKTFASIGDIVTVNIKDAIPNGPIKKGEVVRAVIVRTHFPIKRKDGTTVKFDNNACVLVDKEGNPKGTRVFGAVARELKEKFGKILSLAPEVI